MDWLIILFRPLNKIYISTITYDATIMIGRLGVHVVMDSHGLHIQLTRAIDFHCPFHMVHGKKPIAKFHAKIWTWLYIIMI